ncbi:wax ester/triacylglycerol synthase domain-containing protein [Rhodococcus zopfii]|uniref:wax ester/triacylglycerol synthase domain-containing protein n=1 Tax=Rhodococcus zopfii TaxID=43772 RepID=UPI000934B8D6|nr:wax ester/triacylglycerol synthase domain-containing protein [Rhodococcus zopfii]
MSTAARRMAQTDFLTWSMEQDPALRSTIVAVITLDSSPDWDRIVEMMDRGTRDIPHFRHRVVSVPLGLGAPRWVADPDFDLSWHLRHVALPSPGTFDDVLELARIAAMTAFDRARPLWEFTVIDGIADGRAALMLKVHHALTDGLGGMQMTAHIVDFTREGTPRPEPAAPPEPERPGSLDLVTEILGEYRSQARGAVVQGLRSVWPATRAVVTHPIGAARGVLGTVSSVARYLRPITTIASPVMTDRALGRALFAAEFPLEGLRAAGHRTGCTVNSAFLTALIVGLDRYHREHGADDVEMLRVTMPLSVRRPEDQMGGNLINLARFALPVRSGDVDDLMREIDSIVRRWRGEPAVEMGPMLAAPLNVLPPAVIGSMLEHVDFLASNVPGSPVPLYVAGARAEGYYAFGPTIGSSFNVTMVSYLGVCYLGFTLDVGAVPDQGVFEDCMRAGFRDVIGETPDESVS